MELRQFGSIEIDGKAADAMFCMDADRPLEATIHRWGKEIAPKAVTVSLNRTLDPLVVHRCNPVGSLIQPKLSDEEIQSIKVYRAVLYQNGTGLKGEWADTSGRKGCIVFALKLGNTQVKPQLCANWKEFKEWANRSRLEHDAEQIRGHGSDRFKLKTTLHRAQRHRLERYCSEVLAAETTLDSMHSKANSW